MKGRGHDDTTARSVVFGILVLLVIVVSAAPAGAHAALVSTSPEPGALLDEAPEQVSITFNEPVDVGNDSLRVVDAAGQIISAPAVVDGSSVFVDVPTDLDGWFAVSWQVVSFDGHPLSGGWTYRVGEGSDVAPAHLVDLVEVGQVDDSARLAWGVSQWLSTLGALGLVGTAFVLLVTGAVRSQRMLVVGFGVAGVALSLIAAGLNGPASGTDLAVFEGPASDHYLARAAALAVGSAALWLSWQRWATSMRLAGAAVLCAGLSVTVLSGHARADGKGTVLLVMAHLVIAGAWLGALPALALAAWHGGDGARTTIQRFSRCAVWLAALVVAFGTTAAWVLSGGLDTVAGRWGALLAVKVAAVVLALVAGAWTRFSVLRRWASRTVSQIRRPLIVETGLLVVIAALSIALTHNGPPAEYSDDGPTQLTTTQDDVTVTLVLDPGEVGANDWHLYVTDATGLPLQVEEATVELSSHHLGLAPIPQELSDLGAGHFSGRTEDIGTPGIWDVRVVVRPTPFTQVVLDDTVDVE